MVYVYNAAPGWQHTHPIAISTVTTDATFVKATGTLALRNATETGAAAVCGSLSCTGTHPNTIVAQRTNILEAPGAIKAAVVTDVTVPVVTGKPT